MVSNNTNLSPFLSSRFDKVFESYNKNVSGGARAAATATAAEERLKIVNANRDELKKQNDALQKQNNSLKKKNDELKNENDSLKKEKDSLTIQLENKQSNSKKTLQRFNELEEEIDQLKEINKKAEKKLIKEQKKLIKEQKKNEDAKEKLDLIASIKTIVDDDNDKLKKTFEYIAKIINTHGNIEDIDKKLNEYKDIKNTYGNIEDINNKLNEYEDIKKEFNSSDDIRETINQISSLKTIISDKEEKNKELFKTNEELNQQVSNLSSNKELLQKSNKELLQENTTSKSEIQQLKTKEKELNSSIESLEKNIQQLEIKNNDDTNNKLKIFENEKENLTKKITELNDKIVQLESNINNQIEDNKKLSKINESLNEKNSKLVLEISVFIREEEKLKDTNSKLEANKEVLEKKVSDLEEIIADLEEYDEIKKIKEKLIDYSIITDNFESINEARNAFNTINELKEKNKMLQRLLTNEDEISSIRLDVKKNMLPEKLLQIIRGKLVSSINDGIVKIINLRKKEKHDKMLENINKILSQVGSEHSVKGNRKKNIYINITDDINDIKYFDNHIYNDTTSGIINANDIVSKAFNESYKDLNYFFDLKEYNLDIRNAIELAYNVHIFQEYYNFISSYTFNIVFNVHNINSSLCNDIFNSIHDILLHFNVILAIPYNDYKSIKRNFFPLINRKKINRIIVYNSAGIIHDTDIIDYVNIKNTLNELNEKISKLNDISTIIV